MTAAWVHPFETQAPLSLEGPRITSAVFSLIEPLCTVAFDQAIDTFQTSGAGWSMLLGGYAYTCEGVDRPAANVLQLATAQGAPAAGGPSITLVGATALVHSSVTGNAPNQTHALQTG